MSDITRSESYSGNLLEIAETISKDFISSVLLVDDHIVYSSHGENDGAIDAGKLIDDLAKDKISVCPYLWTSKTQIGNIINLIKNTDVSILDWKIQLQDSCSEEALDADVIDGGDRGIHTQELIQTILQQENPSPHLLIVYTEEPTEVQGYLSRLKTTYEKSELHEDNHVWMSPEKHIRISLFFKKSLLGRHGTSESRVIQNSEQLTSAIISEFAKLNKGILPLALLHSLSILRKNVSNLLVIFNKSLDPAFALHKALLPEPADGDILLMQTLLDAFSSLFFYQNHNHFDLDSLTQAWLDEESAQFETTTISLTLKTKPKCKKSLTIDHGERKKWIKKGYLLYLKDKISEHFMQPGQSKDDISLAAEQWIQCQDISSKMLNFVLSCFSLRDTEKMRMANEDFAILTHHKSIFSPDKDYCPVMMPGCVIQKGGCDEYFLCIQQACDCLRIAGKRNFLFLPLHDSKTRFDIILRDSCGGECKKLTADCEKSYSITTFVFEPQDKATVIMATKNSDGRFVFTDTVGHNFFWCCDLKEAFALKFLNSYVAKLTRVGVDQSEWLRRS